MQAMHAYGKGAEVAEAVFVTVALRLYLIIIV